MPDALYFGCLGEYGHYFFRPDGRSHGDGRALTRWLPGAWDRLADGGLLKNGKIADTPTGEVHWTCATEDRFAFFWWDRSADHRPGSNSNFFTTGIADRDQAFAFACQQFPGVVARQKFPLKVVA